MKKSKPISVGRRSHKDDGCDWDRPGFDEDLRDEIRTMAREGIPVTMRGGKLRYRNKAEGVEFDSDIFALQIINQGRSNWVRHAFEVQIWVERIIKAVSVHGVEEIEQLDKGLLHWWWRGRPFGAYRHRNAFLCLRSSDANGEIYRDDLSDPTVPLTDFMLDSMQKTERALDKQIKIEFFLNKKGLLAERVPNGLDIGAICIRVDQDTGIIVARKFHMSPPSSALLKKVGAYVEEFRASGNGALQEENPQEPMDSSTLDLV